MSQTISSPVTELLANNAIPFDVIEIPLSEDKKPIRNLEELLSGQGRDPNSVVRSLLFKTGSGQFCLLAVAVVDVQIGRRFANSLARKNCAWPSLMKSQKQQDMSLAPCLPLHCLKQLLCWPITAHFNLNR